MWRGWLSPCVVLRPEGAPGCAAVARAGTVGCAMGWAAVMGLWMMGWAAAVGVRDFRVQGWAAVARVPVAVDG